MKKIIIYGLIFVVLIIIGCAQNVPKQKTPAYVKIVKYDLGGRCPNCFNIQFETRGETYSSKGIRCVANVNGREESFGVVDPGTHIRETYLSDKGANIIKLCCEDEAGQEACDMVNYDYR